MTKTLNYYDDNADSFFASTVDVDMSALRERFLARLQPGASILDAGCGSGRDAKAFAAQGFLVAAFDASPALAALASQHIGIEVETQTFADVDEVARYDGIWSCASLLHLPQAEIPPALVRLWRALRAGGSFYLSFKHGKGERSQGGRHFTDVDEAGLKAWLTELPELASIETWLTEDCRPDRTEQWVNALVVKSTEPTRKLVTGGDDPFLPHLSRAMSRASEIDIAVAFIRATGMRLLKPDLELAMAPKDADVGVAAQLRVLTSDYLDVTDPESLRLLLLLQAQGAQVRVYVTQGSSFHLKTYLFAHTADSGELHGTAFVGSSNISRQALQDGLEWNYRISYPSDDGFFETRRGFEALFAHPRTVTLTDAWIESYEKRRIKPLLAVAPGSLEQDEAPEPSSVQVEALASLAATREAGFKRGLVVLATGLGKTWLAAFDARQVGARRVLFVAHREEILQQAAQTFLLIRPDARVGYYMGQTRDVEVDVLCASVQTLGRNAHLERFAPQHFDYIVVDEFHHAAAATYRRLLAYFAPRFLLGLTATPDRTDQSDILSLCDDNLVFTRSLFDGIQAKLLAPFHYHGILDESVDYRDVPWRNGRFDPEALSSKLATLGRARHALKQWREHGQQRTLAFCVSVKHADFMAAQFAHAGIAAAAVYAGSVMGRAEALERLRDGRLAVIFSVDLFNEGVDMPSIDTVLMLRPTESKILFLQQLGRGLRRWEGKSHLVVLDFIGNHQSFLHKPQALFGVGASFKQLADFARKAELGRLELPDGCFVNFDLRIIDFLKSLDAAGSQKDYEALKASLGRRPSLAEFYHSGSSIAQMRRQHGSWFEMLAAVGDLDSAETGLLKDRQAFLCELETTAMSLSYKMVLLEAMLELDGWQTPPTLAALAERSWQVLHRRPPLLADLPDNIRALADGGAVQWQRYWRDNPVNAWVGGNLRNAEKAAAASFHLLDDRFRCRFEVAADQIEVFGAMVQELVDYRLASYELRRAADAPPSNVIPFVPKAKPAIELPYFPNLKIACGHFRAGRTDAEEFKALPEAFGHLDPTRHFIARASGNSMNGGKHPIVDGDYLLLEHLSPTKAGSITGSVMAIERQDEDGGDNQYLLRVVTKDAEGGYVLRANNPDYPDMPATDDMRTLARLKEVIDPLDMVLGQAIAREDIPALFNEAFNPGSWNVGHVVLNDKKVHVLLVTLNKQGKAEEHRYLDRWIDDHTFHWQSQNSTSPAGKRGQEIIEHERLGIQIHLFVREQKLSGGKAAPFVYFGKVRYQSHEGSSPMSVTFSL
ncbi:DUF3427 domain-containing protein [Roseateles oligotrophus]|uniref:DUF3427 domain-containing protein n=1 Tax=Roseateles oligotrophus TaxID=1769250 RepID=A0ABT2Y9I5_9BURK|nr:DUF3427 domain-containing protein [Roseateles oligotrophus]MCV2366966.1 DUF3427 domain-containing protein [Roseateles oligotrophus]